MTTGSTDKSGKLKPSSSVISGWLNGKTVFVRSVVNLYLMENNYNGIIADLGHKGEVTLPQTWYCCICFAINNCIIAR